MYAAAGGASLASRQARQRQRQQKKTQQLQAKLHPPKALVAAEHGASTPTRSTSRQFHQLPTNYLRAPQAHGRKLSASYTGQSKLQLLPIDEGDTQSVIRMHSHAHTHPAVPQYPNAHHQSHHPYVPIPHGRVSPKLMHRHSGSGGSTFHHSHLPKSATATLPLVSQVEATPPTTPSAAAVGVKASAAAEDAQSRMQIQIPHDNIIVTPATPMASPGHVVKQLQGDDLPEAAAETQPLTASYDDDEAMQPPPGPLERKCSVYRMRRSDAFELDSGSAAEVFAAGESMSLSGGGGISFLAKKQLKELTFQQQYEPLILDEPTMMFKGLPNGRHTCVYCEEGICTCEHIECAQGRAAWLERGRRCSVQDSQAAMAAASHRRWVKRNNRIQDASLGGSSDDEDFLGVLRGPSTFANAFLYVGLGTIALGLVIAFVGTGEKGFKTVELRLIGPSLIGLGLICCILRILFCICPSHCISSSKKARKKNGNKIDADHTTSLLRGENKRVSIARGPSMQRYPITHKRSNSKMLNEGMEALRQIATTSLFMQNEQKPSTNRVVPIIKEPENAADASLEMKKLETALNVCEISDTEDADAQVVRTRKTIRIAEESNTTAAITKTTTKTSPTTDNPNATNSSTKPTTTSRIVHEKPPLLRSSSKLSRQRVALNQQQQQQTQQELEQQTQSLSSSSTVKDSIDGDQLMETSLMIINPTTAPASVNEARPPIGTSSGAKPRLTRTPLTVTSIPPPPATAANNTGAISRVTSAPLSYDLPSSTPHTYATVTSMSNSRSAASALLSSIGPERETRVRGPLGMPLSALTATGSRYSSSSSAAATTTTISLLPLPAPPTIATVGTFSSVAAAATGEIATTSMTLTANNAPCIPGQVMPVETSTVQTILLPTKTTTTASNQASQQLLQPAALSIGTPPHISSLASSNVFKFPAPLSSSSNSSSAASSNGRTAVGGNIGTSTLLAPPAPTPASKFEPELVLSPAKLGQ